MAALAAVVATCAPPRLHYLMEDKALDVLYGETCVAVENLAIAGLDGVGGMVTFFQ